MGFKLVLAHTFDPSGPFCHIHPIEKYLHPKAHHAEISAEIIADFWPPQTHLGHMGANNFWGVNSVRSCQTLSNAAINRYIALCNTLTLERSYSMLAYNLFWCLVNQNFQFHYF